MLSSFQYQELERRRIMNTKLIVVFSLVLLIGLGVNSKAQAQNEVTESVTGSYYGTSKMLPFGPDRAYATWEVFGVILSDTGEGLFHNTTNRCVGAWFGERGNWEGEGYCTYTLKDGEKVFMSFKHGGKMGIPPPPAKGTGKFIGGTGKYSGIQGELEFTSYTLRPASEGIMQSCNKGKIRYKLP
jgi:hypothetical protein